MPWNHLTPTNLKEKKNFYEKDNVYDYCFGNEC